MGSLGLIEPTTTHTQHTTHTKSDSMRTELILDDARLLNIAGEWGRLPCPTPMQRPDWLCEWWRVYGKPSSKAALCTLAFYHGDHLVGIAPWYLEKNPVLGSTIRLLGDGEVCSDHADILAYDEHRSSASAEAARWLQTNAGFVWEQLVFEAINENNVSLRDTVNRLKQHGITVVERENLGSWQVALPSTWDEYLASVSKNHRKRCRRWVSEYFDTGRAFVEHSSNRDDVMQGLAVLASMNEDRRKSVGDKSCFASPNLNAFHASVIRRMAENGQAAIRRLMVDGSLVAMEYALYDNEAVYCYQSAMITRSHRDGYGNLSILALIRHALSERLRCVDFLRGNESYKKSWNAHHVPASDLMASTNSTKGKLGNAWNNTKDQLRQIKRRFAG